MTCPGSGASSRPLARGTGLARLTRRSEFLSVARGRSQRTGTLVLQGRARSDATETRVGFTCSRKLGNAVARNRAKRRLRAAARQVLSEAGQPGWDYVLIGRADRTASAPFDALCTDLRRAVDALHTRHS